MKDKIILILIIASMVSAVVYTQSVSIPETLSMTVSVYDQHVFYNDNFENQGPAFLTKGMVKSDLSKTLKFPELVTMDVNLAGKKGTNYMGTMYNPQLFKYFFSENVEADNNTQNSGKNFPLKINLTLTYNKDNAAYEFSSDQFFPINNKGFNDKTTWNVPSNYKKSSSAADWWSMSSSPGYLANNYNYCIKLNSKFTYQAKGEIFKFKGDDDVWVFINNKLAVDLGGLHLAERQDIDLKTLSLTKGTTYDLDFFYCERRATASSMQISTNIEIFCVNDYCGVCNGDGTTCCPAGFCDDKNACTIDKCPKLGTVGDGKFTKNDCVFTNVTCEKAPDQCTSSFCDPSSGCKTAPIVCDSGSADKCFEVNGNCNVDTGCQYKYKCTDNGRCDLGCDGGTCKIKDEVYCGNEFGNDPCYTYKCDNEIGCIKAPKCPQEGIPDCSIHVCNANATNEVDRCEIQSIQTDCNCCKNQVIDGCQLPGCGPLNGECVPKNKTIDDGNLCTIDTCENGTIKNTPKVCGGCSQCDSKTGECVINPPVCDDGNICTKDQCTLVKNLNGSANGICTNDFIQCGLNDTDKCNIWSCDPEKGGCQSTKVICEEKSLCQVGTCKPSTGQCEYAPRVCSNGGAFCLISECDERLGCITYNRQCPSDDSRCQAGICVNGTSDEPEGRCRSVDYDPLPFVCQTAAVVSTAVVAGVTVAGAIALGIFLYGGKKGYDYWQDNKSKGLTGASSNPLYKESDNAGQNPFYNDNNL
ncbi:hypothetical protein RB653_005483 [Dictyostelium firmibasis]|uniref:PA14 domain-containing protein n=1 Tax=Dictyostelium firmibasis TaxID=79012 RepID=A0AAN7YT04_9MYCE